MPPKLAHIVSAQVHATKKQLRHEQVPIIFPDQIQLFNQLSYSYESNYSIAFYLCFMYELHPTTTGDPCS